MSVLCRSLALNVVLASSLWAQIPQSALPQSTVDVSWQALSGKIWNVKNSEQLQAALKSAARGDTIALSPGVVYTGNFQAGPKPGSGWIYIVTSGFDSKHPRGVRVSPADAVDMAALETPNVSQALQFLSGSGFIRVVGIEIRSASTYRPDGYTPGVYYGYALVSIPGKYPPVEPIPNDVIIDRCYIHGDKTHDIQIAVQANFRTFAMVDSYVSDIHMKGTDTQAIGAFYSPGPFLINNNYLEAAGENVMFGGAGGWNNPYVPSDVTVTNNTLAKPLSWIELSTGHNPAYTVKNAFEIKSGQRVLFDRNTIENVWAAAQMGYAIVLTVRSSQSGDEAVVNDVTITNNVLNNVVSFVNTLATDDQCGVAPYTNCHNSGSQTRWNIANNLVTFFDPKLPGGNRNLGLGINGGFDRINGHSGVLRDVVYQHNTMVTSSASPCWNSIFFSSNGQKPPLANLTDNIWILDNVLCRPPTGDFGLQGTAGLKQYMGNPEPLDKRFSGNVIYLPPGDRPQSFPPHNDVSSGAPKFDSSYQLTGPNWSANTTDKKQSGYNGNSKAATPPGRGQPGQTQERPTEQ